MPKRIAWANTSNAEFFLAITNSIQLAAEERGLEFITAIANDDSAKNIVVARAAVLTQNPLTTVLVGLTCGALLGLLNGTLVRALKISPILVTIGTAAISHGMSFVVSDSE